MQLCSRPMVHASWVMMAMMALPSVVAAQDRASVIVMKFEEFDAEPEVVAALGESLSAGISAHADMQVKGGPEMTIKDLTLTAGCGQPDEKCMQMLRDFIDADRVVFGSVQGSGDVHLFSMKMFDFADGRFINSVADQTIEGDVDHVREVLPAVVEGFLYGDVGTLTVEVVGAESPDLIFDGAKVGLAPTTLENLPLGEHVVSVRTTAGDEKSQRIVLRYNQPANVEFVFRGGMAQTKPDKSASGRSIVPGVVSLGLGVIGVGVGAFSSLQVSGANSDNEKLRDQGFVDSDAGAFTDSDAVAAAKSADLDPAAIKKRGETFQTIQWIGYGVGAVGIGVGLVLMIRAMGGEESAATTALPFDFGIMPTADGAAASFRTSF